MKKYTGLICLFMLCCHVSAQAGDCEAIGARLNALASADQQIRQEWEILMQDAASTPRARDAVQQRWRAIDSANLKEVKTLIAACGWPADQAGSHSAWLLAQHADSDLAFQHRAKDLLEAAVKAGTAAARDLAYLSDRIAANEGRPQEYGTQFTQTDRCHMTMLPVDDVQRANARRLAVGLPSLEAYEAEGRRRFMPADCRDGGDRS